MRIEDSVKCLGVRDLPPPTPSPSTCFFRLGSGRGAARAENDSGTPSQSHVSPSMVVYEDRIWDSVYEDRIEDSVQCLGFGFWGLGFGVGGFRFRVSTPAPPTSFLEHLGFGVL